jgi:hypothetical protein
MFKRITEVDEGPFEGYVYTSDDGSDEYVLVDVGASATIRVAGNEVTIYYNDIPKLINALQMAYEYKKGGRFE